MCHVHPKDVLTFFFQTKTLETDLLHASFLRESRAVRRIFCLRGQTLHTPHRVLPFTEKVSSWKFLFVE